MGFKTEKEMSFRFKKFLLTNLVEADVDILKEFRGLFGVPDYLVVERDRDVDSISTIASFELKLNNWRRALNQAFKHRSFSNVSFVVMDEAYSNRALNNIRQFLHFNVGLATFNMDDELKIYFQPTHTEPFSPFFLSKIHDALETKSDSGTEFVQAKLSCILSSFQTEGISPNFACT